MSKLVYKTRGSSNPQGKPRVYFCCYPADFNKYFETISDEILAKQNCAIWYLEDQNSEYDDLFFTDLKQMQLFVVPVTSDFLCVKNRALEVEFKFAVENHIPILPIMQESNLEEMFNKKCGNLQFLSKQNKDATSISYNEKFQKYLESVLIGDELAEKIRAAFDAYVFLSYRKKDRKYAQELMRLIHKNDFCRDIAIWYDEFLTPGENFNDSIKEALKKSDLFVLAVTPNLVNEVNYIMTTEYPMAKKEGKPLISAEMVPTDKIVLAEKYKNIPAPVDAYDEAALSNVLLETIKQLAIKENDKDIEHNFFIGLAYLGGVDVEVDHEKSLLLITNAAEAGLTEAIEKLANMYATGDGVKADAEQSIMWRERLVDILKTEFEKESTSSNAIQLIYSWFDLGNSFFLTEKNEETCKCLSELIEQCSVMLTMFNLDLKVYTEIERVIELSYTVIGNSLHNSGDFAGAKEFYIKALDICERIAGCWKTDTLSRDLSVLYRLLGELNFVENDLEEALTLYQKAIEIQRELYEDLGEKQYCFDISVTYSSISRLLLLKTEFELAKENLMKAIEYIDQLVDSNGAYLDWKIDMCFMLAEIKRVMGNTNEALNVFQDALKLCEKYFSLTDQHHYYAETKINVKISQLYFQLEKYDKALEYGTKAETILEKNFHDLTRYKNNGDDLELILAMIMSLSLSFCDQEQQSRVYLKKAIDNADEIVKSEIIVNFIDCVLVYANMGILQISWEETDAAKENLSKAKALIDKYSIQPDDILKVTAYYLLYVNIGLLLINDDEYESAIENLEKADEMLEHLRKNAPQFYNDLAKMFLKIELGRSYGAIEKNRKAQDIFMEVIQIGENCSSEMTLDMYSCLGLAYYYTSCLSSFFTRKKWINKLNEVIELIDEKFPSQFESTDLYETLKEDGLI